MGLRAGDKTEPNIVCGVELVGTYCVGLVESLRLDHMVHRLAASLSFALARGTSINSSPRR